MTPQRPTFRTHPATRFAGHSLRMSISEDRTQALWSGFMPALARIKGRIGSDLYALDEYPSPDFFRNFDPSLTYRKWAAVPVAPSFEIPDGFDELLLPSSAYAVFLHRGSMGPVTDLYRWIYSSWLPSASLELEDRPHFAIMGDDYRPDHPDSEETIWLPVRKK